MEIEMNDLQRAWVKFLRENPEKQTTIRCLRSMYGRMCCLGAAAQIMIDRGIVPGLSWSTKRTVSGSPFLVDEADKMGRLQSLTTSAWKALGLRNELGELSTDATINYTTYSSLAAMNDWGMKWPEIADYIEANPGNVFTNHEGMEGSDGKV